MRAIRWGILGTGWIADAFANGLKSAQGAQMVAVASRSEQKAHEFARRFGIARSYGSYEALVADGEIDVVYIATPNELHKPHCLMAIAAGKAVLCEKPFALNAAEAAEIIAAARAQNVFCMDAMWMRCSPALKQAMQRLDEGVIGAPTLLHAQLGFLREQTPGSRLFEGPGAGALMDLGVYPLALAQRVFGTPSRVQASKINAGSGADAQVNILLEYAQGQQAVLSASLAANLCNDARIYGPGGCIELEAPLYFCERFSIRKQHAVGDSPLASAGLKSRIKQHRLLRPLLQWLRQLRDRMRSKPEAIYVAGTGYTVEAEEVMRCLRQGLLESPDMPLDATLDILRTVDRIRSAWES
tara:strand:+ start:3793 stop:4860 length:1068 start_codon:yes stop_codon:yes gene_type:complete